MDNQMELAWYDRVSTLMTTPQLPESALVVTTEVADWQKWKSAFDAHEGARKAAGILGHHINRGLDNPNVVTLYLAVGDLAKAKAFMTSADLKQAMAASGVISAPEIVWMKPVLQQIVWDRELPAMLVSHAVADFDAWLAGYKAADAMQKQLNAIVVESEAGHGAVKVSINGSQKILSVKIDPKSMDPDKPEKLEALIMQAVNDGIVKAQKTAAKEMMASGNFKLPGMGG